MKIVCITFIAIMILGTAFFIYQQKMQEQYEKQLIEYLEAQTLYQQRLNKEITWEPFEENKPEITYRDYPVYFIEADIDGVPKDS